jgi:SulP family sulfate permease
MSAVNRIDVTALEALTDMLQDLHLRKIRLHLAELKGPVQDRMQGTALWTALSGRIYRSANDAFEALKPGAK